MYLIKWPASSTYPKLLSLKSHVLQCFNLKHKGAVSNILIIIIIVIIMIMITMVIILMMIIIMRMMRISEGKVHPLYEQIRV